MSVEGNSRENAGVPTARVLVVEDDEALRRSEAIFLRRFGFEVVEAPDGARGVELFTASANVDAVVMDGKMPVMDGFEACRKIRGHEKGAAVPILLVTGMNETQAIEQAYGAGATDFILKPVNFNVLSHRLRHLIENARLQNDLASTRSTLEAFFKTIPTAVVFCDADFKIVSANPASETLFGWSAELIAGLPLRTLFVDKLEAAKVEGSLLSGGRVPMLPEYRFATASESNFWGELTAASVGEGLGYALVVVDVTQKRRAREEQEKNAKMELMGVLAGGIAHDFNNILTAIFSSLELTRLEVEETSRAWKYLAGTQPALEQAKRLAQQLLTFSKGGAPVRRLCDMERIVRQTVEFSLRGSPVAGVFEMGPGLWTANVDEGQIVQVISNLAVNAVQATPKGGRLWVRLENARLDGTEGGLKAGNYLRLTMRDEGCGMDEVLLKRIFDPYFTTKPTGSGLGLATVLSIVKKHEGVVKVTSEAGLGSTFEIYLPAEALSVKVGFAGQKSAPGAAAPAVRRRVLVLEDQELIRAAMMPLLQKCGCEVVLCAEGKEALEAYRREGPFDVAILDMTLPGGMSGLETMRELQKLDPDVRAIVSSGYADDPVMAEPAKYGFCGVLPKPYTFAALGEVLESVGVLRR